MSQANKIVMELFEFVPGTVANDFIPRSRILLRTAAIRNSSSSYALGGCSSFRERKQVDNRIFLAIPDCK